MNCTTNPPGLTVPGWEGLLASVPSSLGYRPRESAVLIGLRVGARAGGSRTAQVGPSARVDLRDLAHPIGGPQLLEDLTGVMERDGCEDVFVVFYTDQLRGALGADPLVSAALTTVRRHTCWADAPGPSCVGDGSDGRRG